MANFSVFGAKGRIGSAFLNHTEKHDEHVAKAMPRKLDECALDDLGHVIFAAGLTSDFRQRPYDTMNAHVSLLSSILQFGSFESLTYLSSTRLYQNATHTGTDAEIIVNPSDPSDIYTLSKLAGEALCIQAGPTVRVGRLSNVVGPGEIGQQTFIGHIAQEALEGHIKLQSGLESSKDYIWLEDVIYLLTELPLHGKEKIYNLAAGRNITHRQWVDAFVEHTNCSYSVGEDSENIVFNEIDIGKTIADFNLVPKPLLPEICSICTN